MTGGIRIGANNIDKFYSSYPDFSREPSISAETNADRAKGDMARFLLN